MKRPEYLKFEYDERASRNIKTQVWRVCAARSGAALGTIKWFGRWRQYTFWPEPETTYNPDCMREIAIFAERLTQKHRSRREPPKRP